jgi:phosphoglycolate phosphatase
MKNLFFDLDGTLTDPAVGIVRCMQHALGAMQCPIPWPDDALKRFIGPPLQESFKTLLGTADPEQTQRAVALYRERFGEIGLFENELFPEIPGVLEALREAGFRLWVVTSKAHVYADRIVDHFELRKSFERVYGAELSGERALKTELIAYALEREQLSARDTCMIGDRKHDIEGAGANGLPSIGILWGFGSRAELERAGASAIVETPAALPEAIRRLP